MAYTYIQLRNAVLRNVIDQPARVTGAVADLVNRAIRDLTDGHNFKCMEADQTYTTAAGLRTLGELPANFKEFRINEKPFVREFDGSSYELDLLPSREDALRTYSYDDADDTGAPKALTWATKANDNDAPLELSLWPLSDTGSEWTDAPAGEYRIIVPYWRYMDDLTTDGETNWFTNNCPQYIEMYATALGFLVNWDEQRAGQWFTLADGFRKLVKKRDATLKTSPSRYLRVRTDVLAPRETFRV